MWTSEQEIPVTELKLGMYVARLDCPWEKTTFPIQGFLVRGPEDIERVSRYCTTVFIDVYKSRHSPANIQKVSKKIGAANDYSNAKGGSKRLEKFLNRYATEKYSVNTAFKQEVPKANKVLVHLEREILSLMENGGYLNSSQLKLLANTASELVASVIRNPDAMVWLSRVRKNNTAVYRHALRLAILGCLVGRQFGLNRFLLVDLTLSLLMTGIGKSLIRKDILKQYRSDYVPAAFKRHIALTLDRLSDCRIVGVELSDIIANYCERLDGSGYPCGKQGDDIPLLAQIAGVVEYFEIQVNPFDIKNAKSPSDAITQLNKVKNRFFDADLVEKFVQAVGIYPTGTLIELNDKRVGIVCSQSYERRLRASVIPLTNKKGDVVDKFKVLDLSAPNQWQLGDNKIRIKRGLAADSLPVETVEQAHAWLFNKNYGTWGRVKNMINDLM